MLEDDAQYCGDAPSDIRALIAAIERWDGWDVVNLYRPARAYSSAVMDFGAKPNQLRYAPYFPATTTAILWSRHGAADFISAVDEIYGPTDHMLRDWCATTGRGYALRAPLFRPSGAESVITPATTAGAPAHYAIKANTRQSLAELRRQISAYARAFNRRKRRGSSP